MAMTGQKFKKQCPCADCLPEDRHRACHDTCEKYLEWKRNWDLIKSEKNKNAIVDDYRKNEMFKSIRHSGKDIYER